MSEIDLIPDDYVHWQGQKRVLRWLALVAIGVIALMSLVTVGLKWQAADTEQALNRLQAEKSITLRQQQRLESLATDHRKFDGQWQLLNGLRGGTRAETIIAVIDQVMEEDSIWFKDWRFERSGSHVEPEFVEPSKGTYVIALDPSTGSGTKTWGIDTSLNIKGGADDHAAFSKFVQTLLLQGVVADVRIVSTSSSPSNEDSNRIEFEIDVLVNGPFEGDQNA